MSYFNPHFVAWDPATISRVRLNYYFSKTTAEFRLRFFVVESETVAYHLTEPVLSMVEYKYCAV